jgi:hypothetical protein
LCQLQIHLEQRLLDMQDVRGPPLDQFRPVPQVGAQRDHLGIGSKRARQQAQPMQLLQPLTIEHVSLAARHDLHVAGIHQVGLDPARFQ